jgi:hypothetical protein
MIKSRKKIPVGHAAHRRRRFLVGKPEGKKAREDLDVGRMIVLK